jgi:accessory colonization factor AcfC
MANKQERARFLSETAVDRMEKLNAIAGKYAPPWYKKYGIKADVLAGPEATWIPRAKQEADVIYEGSEYMLSQFIANHS